MSACFVLPFKIQANNYIVGAMNCACLCRTYFIVLDKQMSRLANAAEYNVVCDEKDGASAQAMKDMMFRHFLLSIVEQQALLACV